MTLTIDLGHLVSMFGVRWIAPLALTVSQSATAVTFRAEFRADPLDLACELAFTRSREPTGWPVEPSHWVTFGVRPGEARPEDWTPLMVPLVSRADGVPRSGFATFLDEAARLKLKRAWIGELLDAMVDETPTTSTFHVRARALFQSHWPTERRLFEGARDVVHTGREGRVWRVQWYHGSRVHGSTLHAGFLIQPVSNVGRAILIMTAEAPWQRDPEGRATPVFAPEHVLARPGGLALVTIANEEH